jgi:hypothetical protein
MYTSSKNMQLHLWVCQPELLIIYFHQTEMLLGLHIVIIYMYIYNCHIFLYFVLQETTLRNFIYTLEIPKQIFHVYALNNDHIYPILEVPLWSR